MPVHCRKRFLGFGRDQDRCFAAAVGGVRKNRPLTTHPMLGSRTRTCVRGCQLVSAQAVAAFPFTLVHARAHSSTSTKLTTWEFSV